MVIKKIQKADFHLGNKLHGQKPSARYGVFADDQLVGFVSRSSGLWNAWSSDAIPKPLSDFGCLTLTELKRHLAKK